MTTLFFGCRRFSRLSSEQFDRPLTEREELFLDRHRTACSECRKAEVASTYALNMLRMATLEPEDAPMFEDRVLRKLKVQQVRESLNYWSPALIGGFIACAVIVVALHMASDPVRVRRAFLPTGEARRETYGDLTPRLELDHKPILR